MLFLYNKKVMCMNEKLNELIDLLDNYPDIKKMNELKNKISSHEIELINNYRNNPNKEDKKKLYENKIISDYLECENNINYLIMEINSKFKRSKCCESNKW